MFANNTIMQMCAGLSIIMSLVLLLVSFMPSHHFDPRDPSLTMVRIFFLVVMLGCMRGAF